MSRTGKAFFVPDPSRIDDLSVPHLITDERPYEIAKTITLGAIDYGNFITDMLAIQDVDQDDLRSIHHS